MAKEQDKILQILQLAIKMESGRQKVLPQSQPGKPARVR